MRSHLSALLLILVLIFGCTTQTASQKVYVCTDGSEVANKAQCPGVVSSSQASIVIGGNQSCGPTLSELLDAVDRSCFSANGSLIGDESDCFECVKTIAVNYRNKAVCAKVTQCREGNLPILEPSVCEYYVDEKLKADSTQDT
ncbi:MAG: hypothetical protein NT157_06245 [Candidatus Micrarchaeota archaeon]|nr:hypothetical protein [Candidatus Micrarchaeota archaeon]